MKLSTVLFLALIAAIPAHAQAANCICTGTGCKVASDPYPPPASGQPTTCTVYKAGVAIGTGPVVPSTQIAASNGSVCQPASANYNPGAAGSVSCLVSIPAQPSGNVTLTMSGTNAAGESAQSVPFTFANVAAISSLPTAPTNPRITP